MQEVFLIINTYHAMFCNARRNDFTFLVVIS
jgi:hypothetical protein